MKNYSTYLRAAQSVLPAVLAFCYPLVGHTQVSLTTAQARQDVVTLAADPFFPDTVVGRDSLGLPVWISDPSGILGRRFDAKGRMVEEVDEIGNRRLLTYGSTGSIAEQRFESLQAGTWAERTLVDTTGRILVTSVDGGLPDWGAILARLGVSVATPLSPPVEESQTESNFISQTQTTGFARGTEWQRLGDRSVPGVYARQTTEAFGTSVSITAEETDKGTLIRDSLGGWRLVQWQNQTAQAIEDPHGMVIFVSQFDEFGRPLTIELGETLRLRYTWRATGSWGKKEIFDRATGEVLFAIESSIREGERRPRWKEASISPSRETRAWLPDLGPIAEWGKAWSPEGKMVASFGLEPFLLIPLEGEGPSWGRAQVFSLAGDTLDFTSDQMILSLATDQVGWPTEDFSFPRRWPQVVANLRTTPDDCPPGCTCRLRRGPGNLDTLIIRCGPPAGGSPPPPGSGGGHNPPPGGGNGNNTPPGAPVQGAERAHLLRAERIARTKLAMPNCAALFGRPEFFDQSSGLSILPLAIFRAGQGVYDSITQSTPCTSGRSAWTRTRTRPEHPRLVFLCNAFFSHSDSVAANKIIHELLHLAGQRENPPDVSAPTPNEIDQRVTEACGT